MNWQGSWQSGTSYLIGDVVEQGGSAFIAIADTSGVESPASAPAFWDTVVRAGADTAQTEYSLVGYSSTLVKGSVGSLPLDQACRSDFGSSARMATSQEIFDTPGAPSGSGPAWVNFTAHEADLYTDAVSNLRLINGQLNCESWTNRNAGVADIGLAVDASNRSFVTASCATEIPVACAVPVQATPALEYVGFSTARVFADEGFSGMHGACQADFGSTARMATTQEVFDSSNAPTGGYLAWVQYTPHPGDLYGDRVSGKRLVNGAMNCKAWTNDRTGTTDTGLVIDMSNYSYLTTLCSALVHVACSAAP